MKARSLKAAVAFYLESRRRLGFALESEGALLENLVEYARNFTTAGLDQRVGVELGAGAPAGPLAPAGTPAWWRAALRALLGRL